MLVGNWSRDFGRELVLEVKVEGVSWSNEQLKLYTWRSRNIRCVCDATWNLMTLVW